MGNAISPVTDLPVPSMEMEGSPTFDYTVDSASAQRIIRVINWDDTDAAIAWLFDTEGDPPQPQPFPGKPHLVVHEVKVEPFDPTKPTGMGEIPNTYPAGSRLTITYKIPDANEVESIQYDIGAEYTTYPSAGLKWFATQDDVGPDVHAGVITPTIEHTLRFEQIKNVPFRAIRRTVGKTNNGTFIDALPGTLLFNGANIKRTFNALGQKVFDIEYKFSEKNNGNEDVPKGWNWYLKPGPSATFELLTKRDDTLIFPMVDFAVLTNFNPEV